MKRSSDADGFRHRSIQVFQKEFLEVVELACHRQGFLCASHELLQGGRNLHLLADDGFDGVLELGRMCCLKEDAHFAGLEAIGQRLITASTMRVADVAVFVERLSMAALICSSL